MREEEVVEAHVARHVVQNGRRGVDRHLIHQKQRPGREHQHPRQHDRRGRNQGKAAHSGNDEIDHQAADQIVGKELTDALRLEQLRHEEKQGQTGCNQCQPQIQPEGADGFELLFVHGWRITWSCCRRRLAGCSGARNPPRPFPCRKQSRCQPCCCESTGTADRCRHP